MNRYIVLDVETTGLDKKKDRIIEISCREIVGKELTSNEFHSYINPYPVEVKEGAYNVHNISTEFLKYYPSFLEISKKLIEFIGSSKIIIHNVRFDIGFLNEEFKRNKIDKYYSKKRCKCTMKNSGKIFGEYKTLDWLCDYFDVDKKKRDKHGASIDTLLLGEVYFKLYEMNLKNG